MVRVRQHYNDNSKMSLSKVDDEKQEKHLREATQYFFGLEKPLKYGPTIDTLNDLINALHHEFTTDYVNIEMVNHIMLSYQSNSKEWKKYAKFDRYKYTRNLVDAGNGKFNLILICWGEAHASAIHDHSDSHCFMKMLKGELCETRYEFPDTNNNNNNNNEVINTNGDINGCNECQDEYNPEELKEIGKSSMEINDVCYINDNLGLHRVENPSHTDTAVSLHLYCPPFDSCRVFQKNSGKQIKCPVTFWSKYGVRQPPQE